MRPRWIAIFGPWYVHQFVRVSSMSTPPNLQSTTFPIRMHQANQINNSIYVTETLAASLQCVAPWNHWYISENVTIKMKISLATILLKSSHSYARMHHLSRATTLFNERVQKWDLWCSIKVQSAKRKKPFVGSTQNYKEILLN